MPMNFPDSDEYPLGGHLINAGQVHKFRPPNAGESQDDYRTALADHVASIDFIESEEIRNKVGWDKWSEEQNLNMLRRKGVKL
jgi:hypothetical protein